ncbi:MAG: hypothetical protein F2534_11245 [Actinobacteria bacterium]|jgi:hypothetical protein|uniref:Unannotated protein n=1 Tax=freshwater metagenome TaxID=449393 RepID=A0A6J6DWR3_9ZZZZ|nr:hypothetical protein [Actinomycetota bacterium]
MKQQRKTFRVIGIVGAATLFVTACGGGDEAGGRTADSAVVVDTTAADDTEATDEATDVTEATVIETTVPAAEPSAGWTVLVYSIADTDLEPFLLDDVTEMGGVGSGPGVNIVSLVDRASDYSSDPVLGIDDWQGGKLLHVQRGSAVELADLGDVNTGDPQLLADFIATGIQQFPAENYALVLSDHGASWPGVGGDESTGYDGLTLAELGAGIAAGLEGAGIDQLDLLGFDACLMATYEVASALAPTARRLLASQELEPGHGWNYGVLQMLNDDPATDVDALASALIDGFEAQAAEQGTGTEITLSLVDLEQMPALDAALTAFTDAVTPRAGALGPIIGRTRAQTLSFGRSPDPSSDSQMVDLGILIGEIGVDALDVSPQADDVIRALNDLVLDRVAGAATRAATGLSIYFPTEEQWFKAEYTEVPAAAGWSSFLQAYYTGGQAIPEAEQPSAIGDAVEVVFVEGGIEVSALFDPVTLANATEATIDYGIVDADGTITYLGSEPAEVSDDGSGLVAGFYDLTALTMSDGIDTAYAYVDLYLDPEAGLVTIDVPLAYYPVGEDEVYDDVILSLVLDDAGDIISETYYVYNPETDAYGELTADPEAIIVPYVFVMAADGSGEWVPTSDVGLYANLPDIAYELEPLEPGTELWVELNVIDFGGNTATIGGSIILS